MSDTINPLILNGKVRLSASFSTQDIKRKYLEINIDTTEIFAGIEEVDLYECVKTAYRFYYPFNIMGDAEFYKRLSLSRKNYYLDRWEHNRALGFIKTTDKVLEIGSGFGVFLEKLQSKGIGYKGLEINPHAIIECQRKGLNVINSFVEEEAKQNRGKYDVVCCFQVLEHITDVRSFIESSVSLLKKDGKLIIGVPNNNPYLHVFDKYHTLNLPPHHAGLWNKKSLMTLADVFQMKNKTIIFEPLSITYDYFLSFQMKHHPNKIYRKLLVRINNFIPKLLRKFLLKTISGRNILAVYSKS
jgi:2-polyprenyl-3-methyl-5-hydroxy-6-metoxy-1,4-benzoquinol methylase